MVVNQTATKKDNGLYEVDMIFSWTLKRGEQFQVVARQGNKSFTVYSSTDVQITKRKYFFGHIHLQPYYFALKFSRDAKYICVCKRTDV